MNYTEGPLNRAVPARGRSAIDDLRRQKHHFEKARRRKLEMPISSSDVSIPYFDSSSSQVYRAISGPLLPFPHPPQTVKSTARVTTNPMMSVYTSLGAQVVVKNPDQPFGASFSRAPHQAASKPATDLETTFPTDAKEPRPSADDKDADDLASKKRRLLADGNWTLTITQKPISISFPNAAPRRKRRSKRKHFRSSPRQHNIIKKRYGFVPRLRPITADGVRIKIGSQEKFVEQNSTRSRSAERRRASPSSSHSRSRRSEHSAKDLATDVLHRRLSKREYCRSSSLQIAHPVPQRPFIPSVIESLALGSDILESTIVQVGGHNSPVPASQRQENEAWRAFVHGSRGASTADRAAKNGFQISPGVSARLQQRSKHGRSSSLASLYFPFIRPSIESCHCESESPDMRSQPRNSPEQTESESSTSKDYGRPYSTRSSVLTRSTSRPQIPSSDDDDDQEVEHENDHQKLIAKLYGIRPNFEAGIASSLEGYEESFRGFSSVTAWRSHDESSQIIGHSKYDGSMGNFHVAQQPNFKRLDDGTFEGLSSETEMRLVRGFSLVGDARPSYAEYLPANKSETCEEEAWKAFVFGDDGSEDINESAFNEAKYEVVRHFRQLENSATGTRSSLRLSSEIPTDSVCESFEGPGCGKHYRDQVVQSAQAPTSLAATVGSSTESYGEERNNQVVRSTQAPMSHAATFGSTTEMTPCSDISDLINDFYNTRTDLPLDLEIGGPMTDCKHSDCCFPVEYSVGKRSEISSEPLTGAELARSQDGVSFSEKISKFVAPKAFIGKRSDSTKQGGLNPLAPLNTRKKGAKRVLARDPAQDIRSIPNYSSDPIEDDMPERKLHKGILFGALDTE